MRQTGFLIIGATILSAASASAADPQLLNMVMPDATILAGVNAANTRISPFGVFVISKISALGADQKFIQATGFDPLQDVTEVLAATNLNLAAPTSSATPVKPVNLLLVRGNFNVAQIVAAATGKPRLQVQTYDNATLLSVANPKANTADAVAFIGNSIAVAGDLAAVEAAVTRNGTANSMAPALAIQINQLSSSEDEWLVSSVSVASLIPPAAPAPSGPAAQVLPILKSIQSFSGGVNFSTNIQFTGQAVASDAQNAAALGAVIKLGANLIGSLSGGRNAELSQLTQLLEALQVTTSGPDVNLALAIPETQVEALLNQALKPATPDGMARHHAIPRPNGN